MAIFVFWLTFVAAAPLMWSVVRLEPERQRIRRPEGAVRLVGGRTQFQGNVEIYHLGHWGSVCDDEWDQPDGDVVCRQLGFVLGAAVATTESRFGKSRRLIWMDNVQCEGREPTLARCQFDGWNQHDCSGTEAAGVICQTRLEQQQQSRPTNRKPGLMTLAAYFAHRMITKVGLTTTGDGLVELHLNNGQKHNLCADGFGAAEAQIVCRQLLNNQDEGEVQVFSSKSLPNREILTGLKCSGSERSLSECRMIATGDDNDECPSGRIAGVRCSASLPDLIPDAEEVEHTAFLEDRSILFLQCAMEENCLSHSAYALDKSDPEWIYETRRLLRFTARIKNQGRADFRPFRDKSQWQWHSCHRHYHSMEVFATFDVLDPSNGGTPVAQGHKASFCLEDNECETDGHQRYACADYGDQGISVNCVDIYKYDIDCQWIDITDIGPGYYRLKIAINPEMKVPELTYANNAVRCDFFYHPGMPGLADGIISNCTVTAP